MNTTTEQQTTTAPAPAPAVQMIDPDEVDRHELTVMTPHPLVAAPANDFSPRTLDEALKLCEYLAKSDLVPKDYQGKPGNCFVAIQWGAEIGLKPLQAMQNIAPINGRPTLWGDAQLALVRNSPHCEYVLEDWDADGTAVCRAKRRGEPEQVRTWSIEDNKLAGLQGKSGPHTQYAKRMRQLRARSFALRDVFTDVLRGIPQAEEVLFIKQQDDVRNGNVHNQPGRLVAAAAAATGDVTRQKELVTEFEKIAKDQGYEALKSAWGKLNKDDRAALGIAERDRIAAMAQEADKARAGAAS